jgi:hypothetical protein
MILMVDSLIYFLISLAFGIVTAKAIIRIYYLLNQKINTNKCIDIPIVLTSRIEWDLLSPTQYALVYKNNRPLKKSIFSKNTYTIIQKKGENSKICYINLHSGSLILENIDPQPIEKEPILQWFKKNV